MKLFACGKLRSPVDVSGYILPDKLQEKKNYVSNMNGLCVEMGIPGDVPDIFRFYGTLDRIHK